MAAIKRTTKRTAARTARTPARSRSSSSNSHKYGSVLVVSAHPDDPDFGPEVQVDYPGYRSTRWRAPKRPLVPLPEKLHSPTGPVFGEEAVHGISNVSDYEPTARQPPL